MTPKNRQRLTLCADWALAAIVALGLPVALALWLDLSPGISALLGILCGQCAAIYLLVRGRLF